jgi:CHAT domain-containing protein
VKKRRVYSRVVFFLMVLWLIFISFQGKTQEDNATDFVLLWKTALQNLQNGGNTDTIVSQFENLHYQWRDSFNTAEAFAAGGNFNFLAYPLQKEILDSLLNKAAIEVKSNYKADTNNSINASKLLYYIARSQFFTRSFEDALLNYYQAEDIIGDKKNIFINTIYESIADTYEEIAEYEIAVAYYHILLEKYNMIYGASHHRVALLHEKLGICYSHIEDERLLDTLYGKSLNDLAKYHFEQSYQKNLQYFKGENRFSAVNLFQIGISTYYKIHFLSDKQANSNIEKSIHLLKKSIRQLLKFYPEEVKLGNVYNILAFCYSGKKEFDSTKYFLKKSYKTQLKNRGKYHPMTMLATDYLAEIVYKDNIDSSLYYLQKALTYCIPDFHPKNLNDSPNVDMFRLDNYMFRLINKMKTRELKRKYDDCQDFKYLDIASQVALLNLETYKEILKTQHLSAEFGQWTKELDQLNKIYYQIMVQKYHITGNVEYLDTIINVLEENTRYSNVLREDIGLAQGDNSSSTVNKTQDVPPLSRMNGKMAALTEKNHNSFHQKQYNEVIRLQKEYFYLSIRKQELHKMISISKSNKRNIKHTFVKLETIRQNISGKSLLMKYIVMPDRIDVIAISKKDVILCSLPSSPQKIKDSINIFFQSLFEISAYNTETKHYTTIAHNLFKMIFPKKLDLIKDNKSRLLIYTDDFLSKIPFEALLTKNTDEDIIYFNKLPYLINQYSISILTSLDQIFAKHKVSNHTYRYVGFSPKYKDEQDLKFNRIEIESIAKTLQGKSFTDNLSNKNNFLKHLKSSDIIQLSSHSILDAENPLNSSLIFDNPKNEYLSIANLYSYKVDANLVIMSACQTGNGKLLEGEGAISFARTMLYSGADCTIASRWDVNDKASHIILSDFAKNLKKGENIQNALRNAKLNYIRSSDAYFAHPYFWANYIVMGNDKQKFEWGKIEWWLIFIGLIGFILVYKIIKRN